MNKAQLMTQPVIQNKVGAQKKYRTIGAFDGSSG